MVHSQLNGNRSEMGCIAYNGNRSEMGWTVYKADLGVDYHVSIYYDIMASLTSRALRL